MSGSAGLSTHSACDLPALVAPGTCCPPACVTCPLPAWNWPALSPGLWARSLCFSGLSPHPRPTRTCRTCAGAALGLHPHERGAGDKGQRCDEGEGGAGVPDATLPLVTGRQRQPYPGGRLVRAVQGARAGVEDVILDQHRDSTQDEGEEQVQVDVVPGAMQLPVCGGRGGSSH